MEGWQLKQLQSLPLEVKIEKSKLRVREWYNHWNGQVYVSFSGGKDSTVLLHIVREMYPDVKAVFVDTGLEYPEIREFVKSVENVDWLKPKMNFREVIDTYGYPVVSKEQAQYIREAKHTNSEKLRDLRLNGRNGSFKISKKWLPLLDAPFEVSEKCCAVMKKNPIKIYEKKNGYKPFIGTMADESMRRQTNYLKFGCNAFDKKNPSSTPLGFWTEQDILRYIKQFNIQYASVYGEIVEHEGKLITTQCDRTGCMFCMFGCHLEKEPNKFQKMKESHPKIYEYCINNLGLGKVLDYIGVKY